MRTTGIWAGALALGVIAPALAQAPAAGTATQSGAWGRNGWVAGAPGAAPVPVAAVAPAPIATAVAAPEPVQPGAGTPMMPNAPAFEHRWMTPGAKVPKAWRDQRYAMIDWPAYGFAQPGPGMRWMRYYDDAALVDERGRVIDVRHDIPRAAPRAVAPAYAYAPAAPQPAYPAAVPPVPGTVRTGPHTTVTTSVTTVAPPVEAGGAWYGGQVVSVTPGYVVTTTTRTTEVIRQPSRASRSRIARR